MNYPNGEKWIVVEASALEPGCEAAAGKLPDTAGAVEQQLLILTAFKTRLNISHSNHADIREVWGNWAKCGDVANSWSEVLAANILLPRLGMSKKRRVYLLPAVRVDKVAELLVIWGFGARGLRRDVSTRLMSESYLNITGRTLVCKNSQCKRFLPTFYRAFIFHFSQQIAKKTFRKTDS